MRNLHRNTTVVKWQNYTGKTEQLDKYGNKTGSFQSTYSDVKQARMYVSASTGNVSREAFGLFEDYDRVISTADTNVDIDELSVLYLDGSENANYVVRRKAVWKNSVLLAVQRIVT